MKRKLSVYVFLFVAMLLGYSAALAEDDAKANDGGEAKVVIEKIKFDKSVKIGDEEVPLKGGGLLEWLTFNVYTAAFYAPESAKTIDEVLAPDVPKCLTIEYARKIDKDEFIEFADEKLRENPANDMEALQPTLDKINAVYRSVKKGDRYTLTYEPGVGTSLFYNGEKLGTMEGEDIQRAYFGIWLSEYCINKKFRDKLLGRNK